MEHNELLKELDRIIIEKYSSGEFTLTDLFFAFQTLIKTSRGFKYFRRMLAVYLKDKFGADCVNMSICCLLY